MAQNDFETLTRQYWNAWGEAMRGAAAPAQPAQPTMPGWNEAMNWWSQMAKGAGTASVNATVDDAVDRFNSQARDWYGQIQQLAARFAGRSAQPADIAAAWQQMLGAQGMHDLFKGMQGPGQHGLDQWMEQMGPLLQTLQRDGKSWLGLPAFGFTREHQERWQELARAQMDHQEKSQAYNALMGEALQLALRRFEDKLAERSEPGRQLASARALFDLWIDAAEDAYAEIALSPRFRQVYGEHVNAQMRVRAAAQREVEQMCGQLGMPTRTEVDAAHRKIVQLERELRRIRDAMAGEVAQGVPAEARPASKPATKAAPKPATRPVRAQTSAAAVTTGKIEKAGKNGKNGKPKTAARPSTPKGPTKKRSA